MAGARKKAKKPSPESSGEESDSGSYHGQKEIQADFEGRNPEPEDFHGIKQLLKQLFLKAHIDLSQMTDMLIAQTGLGSVLKQSFGDESDDEDDMSSETDVFGITTVLNLTLHRDKDCVQQLISLIKELSDKHSDKNTVTKIKGILDNNAKLGLLINERFINIPAKISDPLLTSLLAELERAKKRESTYNFDYFVLICKLHKSKGGSGITIFANAEEEIFAKEAEISFEFDVTAESDTSVTGKWTEGDTEMLPQRQIVFLPANKIQSVVQQIKQFVG